MSKLKRLSNEELFALAGAEFVELTKQFRDGDEHALDRAKYAGELARRGLKLSITRDFIHRIFIGEFDNCDGVEATVVKVEGN